MKTCTKCNEVKELSYFYKNKAYSDGYVGHCKACKREAAALKKPWLLISKEQKAVTNKTYRAKNIEKIKLHNSEYKKANRAYFNNQNAIRRARMTNGEIPKEEYSKILLLYTIARSVSKSTGVQMHVDHIKPLSRGGRHTLDNLQILTAVDNMSKGCREEGRSY